MLSHRRLWFLFGNRIDLGYMNMLRLVLGIRSSCSYMCRNLIRIRFLGVFLGMSRCNSCPCRMLFFRCLCRLGLMNRLLLHIRSTLVGFRLCNMCLIGMGRNSYLRHLLRLDIRLMGYRSNLLRSNVLRYFRRRLIFLPFLLAPIRLLLFLLLNYASSRLRLVRSIASHGLL